MSGVLLLFKIVENFTERKPFKTLRKAAYFEQNRLGVACLIHALPYLHTTPVRHLIKIRTFLRKTILIWKNTSSRV